MIIKEQIRLLIPVSIAYASRRISDEIEQWLATQNIDAYASVAYGVNGYKIEFPDLHHRTMFLLKYAEYVIL